MLTVRVGCRFSFDCPGESLAMLILAPHRDPARPIVDERINFEPARRPEVFCDAHGNTIRRVVLARGLNRIRHDAIVLVPPTTDAAETSSVDTPFAGIPPELLRYTLPSRYCESDKLMTFAWQRFGHLQSSAARVRAICDWVHDNIEYRFASGSPQISAHDVISRGFGVCRDFAHCVVALCRAFNLPARYVTGHLPDIGYQDPGTPMDFPAYAEVYFGGRWHTFDARYNVPRIGRVKLAHGLDAVDCAFSTTFGSAPLVDFEVWAYQIDPNQVSLREPVDLSKRLDGTPEIKWLKPDGSMASLTRD